MSPEQASGQRADQRSDVWALGVILFEMLAGVRPFAADDPRAAIDLILTRDPDLRATRPDLAPGLTDLVHRALARYPTSRFANGGEVLEALQRCRTASAPSAARRRGARARALRTGAPVLGLLILVTVLALRIRANPEPAPARLAAGSVSHVLWVDDDPTMNAGVIRQLRDQGVQVTTSLNTADALRRYDPAVHQLVISDMGRYEGANDAYIGRAGFDLLARLRVRHDDVQLVFCTSSRAATTHRAEALASGALHVFDDCEEILHLIGF